MSTECLYSNLPVDISLDIETTGLDRDSEIVSAAASWFNPETDALESVGFWLNRYSADWKEDDERFRAFLRSTLFDKNYSGTIIFHSVGFDLKLLMIRYWNKKHFCTDDLCKIADTMVISRMLKHNKYIAHTDPMKLKCHSLKFLSKEFLGEDHPTFESVTRGINIDLIKREQVLEYNRRDAKVTVRLYRKFVHDFLSKSKDRQTRWAGDYYEEEESPHIMNVFHVNWSGDPYDVARAKRILEVISQYKLTLETEIHNSVGYWFNISSAKDLARAIFNNPRLRYMDWNHQLRVIEPYYETEKGQSRVDSDTWIALKREVSETDPSSGILKTLDQLIQYSEITKTETTIERHLSFVVKTPNGYRVYPNFTADAISGRIRCSKPNFMGLSKAMHKKSKAEDTPEELKNFSVRHLVRVDDDQKYTICSIDINALDPSVFAQGAIKFNENSQLKRIFRKRAVAIDLHLAIAQAVVPEKYLKVFGPIASQFSPDNYWVTKPKNGQIRFINKNTDAPTEFVLITEQQEAEINSFRGIWKVFNLMVAYIVGSTTLARKLRMETGEPISIFEAQEMLNKFYETFPEIRDFQDDVANKIYRQGYVQSPFGNKYYANVFDDLNEHFQNNIGNDYYKFICKINNRYWLVECENWEKDGDPIKNLRWVETPSGLKFKKISRMQELDDNVFRPAKKARKKSKFRRKTEDNLDEILNYELTRIQLTQDTDKYFETGFSRTIDGEKILFSFKDQGFYVIPEKYILFYKVDLPNPSSQYFKIYKALPTVVRKFFPLYCQGVAATLSKKCFTEIRVQIERLGLDAMIIMALHDQFDVEVRKDEADIMDEILDNAIKSDKAPFDIPLVGTLEKQSPHLQ